MTPFQKHVTRWKNCTRCDLHKVRNMVVFARGTIPCDMVFVGEAPGESENVLGQPFIGPAGKLLDRILERALSSVRYCFVCKQGNHYCLVTDSPSGEVCSNGHGAPPTFKPTYAMTNLVGCIPRMDNGDKAIEPSFEEIQACAPRLQEFVEICKPKLVICVGKLAEEWLKPGYKHSIAFKCRPKLVSVVHPAAILRANMASQDMMAQRCIVTIRNAASELGV